MRYMFTMMNNARLGVGVEGLGLAERSYQQALGYAQERKQGFAPGAARGEKSFIVEHPDVRRQLLTMKAYTESMRVLAYKVAEQIDVARHGADEAARTAAQEMVDLLIPLAKSYCTDVAETVTSIGIQVHGGMGFIEETGVAQYYRDAKITQIYEGTNGIQAMDLVGRKLPDAGRRRLPGPARPHAGHHRGAGGRRRRARGHPPTSWSAAVDALEDASRLDPHRGHGRSGPGPVGRLAVPAPVRHHRGRLAHGRAGAWRPSGSSTPAAATPSSPQVKLVTARFFAEHLLPQVHGLVAPVKAGKDDLFALTADQL